MKKNDFPPLAAERFGYSDPAMKDALHDIPLLRRFAGLDAFEEMMPDESTDGE